MRRPFAFLIFGLLGLNACSRRSKELDDIEAWIENTYNPHQGGSDSYGHGRTGWYSRDGDSLVFGSIESVTFHGCEMKFVIKDDPRSESRRDVHTEAEYVVKLFDINPSSISVDDYSHWGVGNCKDYTPGQQSAMGLDCDHSEISYATNTEAPLIGEKSHTVFDNLSGLSHDLRESKLGSRGFFEVDDTHYARRLASAFNRAVILCGGKSSDF